MSKWNNEVAEALLTAESIKDSFSETISYELDKAKESITGDGFTVGGGKLNKGISLVIAIALVIMIFLAGPATAFTVDWSGTPTSTYLGSAVNIVATISKNNSDAYGNDVNAIITGPNGNITIKLGCDPTTMNYVSGYGYGYGYGYGDPSYNLTCSGSFTPSAVGSYNVELVTNGKTIGTTTINIMNRSSGSTVTNSSSREVVSEFSVMVTDLSEEELRDILEESRLTSDEIEEYLKNIASGDIIIERTLIVEKIVESGFTSYISTFTLEFINNSSKDLKNVKIVEIIPKSIAETANEISSTHSFKVLLRDPILEFSIPSVKAGESAKVTYTINKNVTKAEFASMTNALGKYEVVGEEKEDTIIVPDIIDEEDLIVTQVPEQQDNTTATRLFGLGALGTLVPLGLIALILIGLIILILKRKNNKTSKKGK